MALKFCSILAKVLKLKVRKFWRVISTFVEVVEEKLVGGLFAPPPPIPTPLPLLHPFIVNRVKNILPTCLGFIFKKLHLSVEIEPPTNLKLFS